VVISTLQILLALLQFLIRVLLLSIVTKDSLVNHGMEDLFLPAVILATVALELASFFVLADEVARLPRLTDLKGIVLEEVGLASEVLPIVCVDTLSLVMFSVVGAPLCLKVKHIEFLVSRHLVD